MNLGWNKKEFKKQRQIGCFWILDRGSKSKASRVPSPESKFRDANHQSLPDQPLVLTSVQVHFARSTHHLPPSTIPSARQRAIHNPQRPQSQPPDTESTVHTESTIHNPQSKFQIHSDLWSIAITITLYITITITILSSYSYITTTTEIEIRRGLF